MLAAAVREVTKDNQVMAVECGARFSMAVTSDGDLYAWGNNCFGQLGVAQRLDRTFEWRPNHIKLEIPTQTARGSFKCRVLQVVDLVHCRHMSEHLASNQTTV